MTGPTTKTPIASLASLIAREAEYVRQNRHDLTQAVHRDVLPVGADSLRLNEMEPRVAQEVPDGDQIQIKRSESKGVVFVPEPRASDAEVFTDFAGHVSNREVFDNVPIMVDAILKKKNQDVIAAYKTFTASEGGNTTELTVDLVKAAKAALMRKNASTDLIMVTTIEGWSQLVADLQTNGADILSDAAKDTILRGVIAEANIGALFGFTPLVTNVVDDSTDANFVAFYERRAVGYVYAKEYHIKVGDDVLRQGVVASMSSSYECKKWLDRMGLYYELKPSS